MEKLTKLFEPGKIGNVEIRNRIIMAPLGLPLATENGYSTDRQIAFYAARARGGVGLIQVSTRAMSTGEAVYVARTLNLVSDDQIPSAQRFTSAMHALGAKVSFMLSLPGIRISESLNRRPPETHPERLPVFAPSAIPHPSTGWMPRELTRDDIQQLVTEFGAAARRGKLAGFDGALVQGGHGYLIHQFLSARTNIRKDEYGGSLEKRCRFGCEIIAEIRKSAGPDFAIVFRLNGNDFVDDGIQPDEAVEHARIFANSGADSIDVSAGPREAHHWQFITMYQPSGALIPYAAAIKKAVKVPVSVAGKIDVLLAERTIEEGSADFVTLGRPLIVDPDLPEKAKIGKLEDIRPCIYCNQCRDRRWLTGDWEPCCSVNVAAGKEISFKPVPAPRKKKIMVVGGGLAGMEAARTLAERGHDALLYEKTDKLGGQWNIVATRHPELASLTKYMSGAVDKAGVKVFLNSAVDLGLVQKIKPDAVIVACGAKPAIPNVPGIDNPKVVLAVDVITGKAKVKGDDVVVVGGHLVGMDTALLLSEQGKKVSIIEMYKMGWGLGGTLKLALLENLVKHGVYLHPDSTLNSVTPNGVYILWDGGEVKTRGAERHEFIYLKADTVVLATGSKCEAGLAEQLSGIMNEVYKVGDCVKPRDAFSAIHEGSEIARKI